MTTTEFYYSNKYEDDFYEYRHVHVPRDLAHQIPKNRLMNEDEWRSLGVQQSHGWVHFMIHLPEKHILLFRRPLTTERLQQKKIEESMANSQDTVNVNG